MAVHETDRTAPQRMGRNTYRVVQANGGSHAVSLEAMSTPAGGGGGCHADSCPLGCADHDRFPRMNIGKRGGEGATSRAPTSCRYSIWRVSRSTERIGDVVHSCCAPCMHSTVLTAAMACSSVRNHSWFNNLFSVDAGNDNSASRIYLSFVSV